MKKKWSTVIAAVLATVMLVTASVPALAESEDVRAADAESAIRVRQALAIEAPRRADPGETVTMTVTERGSDQGVKDAAVWALTRENAEALQAEIANSRQSVATAEADTPPVRVNFEDLVSVHGTFLGNTNGSGQLRHTFEEEGFSLLVALKPGYFPDRTGIAIKGLPQALAIEAPRKAELGEEVTLTVVQRGSETPVEGSAVWALKLNLDSLDNVPSTLLGNTDENGQLRYSFSEEGFYLLLANKTGYLPGLNPIMIGTVNIPGVTPEVQPTTTH